MRTATTLFNQWLGRQDALALARFPWLRPLLESAYRQGRKDVQKRQKIVSNNLASRHAEYMKKYTATGGHALPLITPCCHKRIMVPAPKQLGMAWDSLMACPHCETLFMKVATSCEAVGRLVPVSGNNPVGVWVDDAPMVCATCFEVHDHGCDVCRKCGGTLV
jgi:hypothetical protein